MIEKVQRYSHTAEKDFDLMVERNDGGYVKIEDYYKKIEAQKIEIERLRDLLVDMAERENIILKDLLIQWADLTIDDVGTMVKEALKATDGL